MTDTATPPAAPPRLVRDPAAGHWLGVAAGLGRYFRIDPVIPRVAFVVLSFVGGLGLLLYLALWLVMPEEHETTTLAETAAQRLRDAPTWLSVTLIVLGILWLGGIVGYSAPGLVWGLALVGLGVLLFQQDTARQAATEATVPPPPEPGTAAAGAPPSPAARPVTVEGAPPRPVAPPVAPAAPADPPPPPSILGRLTVAVALLVIGGVALVSNLSGAALGARAYLALALLVVGAGLLVGAWWGRARWLIAVGLVLLPLALVTGVRGLPAVAGGGVGDRLWQPRTAAELDEDFSLFAGEAVLDLTALALPGGAPTTVTGSVVLGEFTVVVPAGLDVAVQASVVAGEVTVFGITDSGLFVDVDRGAATADADVILELGGGFGELHVQQSPAEQSPTEQTRLR